MLNSVSFHRERKQSQLSLADHSCRSTAVTPRRHSLVPDVILSSAGSCLGGYWLQGKDRHGGNILLYLEGHIINSGSILSSSP